MKTRLGATVHEEGDFRVVEVLSRLANVESVVGFTVVGPGIEPLIISPDVATAVIDLQRMAKGLTPWPLARSSSRYGRRPDEGRGSHRVLDRHVGHRKAGGLACRDWREQ
jgi:hypothetical protein